MPATPFPARRGNDAAEKLRGPADDADGDRETTIIDRILALRMDAPWPSKPFPTRSMQGKGLAANHQVLMPEAGETFTASKS
ncbi:hypothetical protein ACIGB6_10465 [Paeniglutamicibacter gangotriensis]|uniref:hypothetical protein n=1 Tax=Paeniglutamicibacter gangotriensis TaxID=254787 RepID=UPI0037CAC35F